MKPRLALTRSNLVLALRRRLERDSSPRIQMSLLVALAGAAGFVCSFALLTAGVVEMALRYPLALSGAYGVFFVLLWLWLRGTAEDYVDLAFDVANDGTTHVVEAVGHFADAMSGPTVGSKVSHSPASLSSSSAADATGSVFDADELAIPLLVVALALGLAFASLYIVYLAPELFAEILVDGALSYSLYRHLRTEDSSRWLSTAFRRTVVPFVVTSLFVAAVGAALQHLAPDAHTLGEAIRSIREGA